MKSAFRMAIGYAGLVGLSAASPAGAEVQTPGRHATGRRAGTLATGVAGGGRLARPRPAGKLADYLTVIRNAEDPAVAASAFDRGRQLDPGSLELHKAFLERMIEAGTPASAEESARKVLLADPGNGPAWAVTARAHAHAGRVAEALAAIVQAAKAAPDDPFVLTATRELLAQYARQKDRLALAEPLKAAVEGLEARLAGRGKPANPPAKPAAGSETQPARRERGADPGGEVPAPVAAGGSTLTEKVKQVDRRIGDLKSKARRLKSAMASTSPGRWRRRDRGPSWISVTRPRDTWGYPGFHGRLPYGRVGHPYGWRGGWSGSWLSVGGSFTCFGGRLAGGLRIGSNWTNLPTYPIGTPGRTPVGVPRAGSPAGASGTGPSAGWQVRPTR